MKYYNPADVISPKEFVSNVRVLYDGKAEGISIAKINWSGNDCLAIRWNISRREWDEPKKIKEEVICKGMPTSRGIPVWLVLPGEVFEGDSDIYRIIKNNL
jgi:hypothetical protein